jgi:hypothetical protein
MVGLMSDSDGSVSEVVSVRNVDDIGRKVLGSWRCVACAMPPCQELDRKAAGRAAMGRLHLPRAHLEPSYLPKVVVEVQIFDLC